MKPLPEIPEFQELWRDWEGGPTFVGVVGLVEGIRQETGAEQGDEGQLLHLLLVGWEETSGSEGLHAQEKGLGWKEKG